MIASSTVGAHAFDLDAPVEHARLTRAQVTCKSLDVPLTQCGGHDQFSNRSTYGVGAFVAEGFFRCRVELDDETGLIDRDDAVESRSRDGRIQGLARVQRRDLVGQYPLAAFHLREIARKDEIALDGAGLSSIWHVHALHDAAAPGKGQPTVHAHGFARQCALGMRLEQIIRGRSENLCGGAAQNVIDWTADEFGILAIDVAVPLIAIEQRDARRNAIQHEPQPRISQSQEGFAAHGLAGTKI